MLMHIVNQYIFYSLVTDIDDNTLSNTDQEGEEETTNSEVGMKCNDLVISENKEEYIGPAIGDDETLNSGGSQYNKDEYLTYNGMEI